MDYATCSTRIAKLLAGTGPLKLMTIALQEAKFALLDSGFKFGTYANPTFPDERERVIEPLLSGAQMRVSVPMVDPTHGYRMELWAYLFAHFSDGSGGRIYSWLEAVTSDLAVSTSVKVAASRPEPAFAAALDGRILVRHELFCLPIAETSLTDSALDDLLSSRLSGEGEPGEEHDFAGKGRAFVAKLEGVLNP